ncbi:AfsR/SARP family transcriptional regulator [Arthrobacter antioxidans]|uniref:AfsR/SARP family transcriptional regulator n=1 Tax=Arthrobacter antioxidans TaxID=2895818 RepID=UPI001FFE2ED0|nr:BTAD domain-containing putative transcriptional regulator [Arthrobacter antioxidans]
MNYTNCKVLRLELLRAWRLHRHGVLVHVATRQQRLIAALAIKGPCLRSYLAGLLWPECPDARALESLRVSVHVVTRQIPGLLVNDGPMLSLSDQVDVDLHRVQAQIADLEQPRPEVKAADLLRDLRDARLLSGWYDDWVMLEQNRLQQDCLRACTIIAKTHLDQRSCETAGAAAEAALEIEPLYEEAVRLLITAELQHGNPAAAVRAYQRYQTQLDEDMGLRPSESLTLLVSRALDGQLIAREAPSVPINGAGQRRKPLTHRL